MLSFHCRLTVNLPRFDFTRGLGLALRNWRFLKEEAQRTHIIDSSTFTLLRRRFGDMGILTLLWTTAGRSSLPTPMECVTWCMNAGGKATCGIEFIGDIYCALLQHLGCYYITHSMAIATRKRMLLTFNLNNYIFLSNIWEVCSILQNVLIRAF